MFQLEKWLFRSEVTGSLRIYSGSNRMATWQYDLYLVPRERVEALCENCTRIPEQLFETVDWWEGCFSRADDHPFLSQLKEAWPAEAGMRVWRSSGDNRLTILYESSCIDEVYARIDLRYPDLEFIEGVLTLARDCDCILISRDLEVLPPQKDAILSALRRSEAARFLIDPYGFFDDLSQRADEPPE